MTRRLRLSVAVFLVVASSACSSPEPPQASSAVPGSTAGTATTTDAHPDWPTEVVLAVPPGTSSDVYAKPLRLYNQQVASSARQRWHHPLKLVAYEPQDLADTVEALVDGRVQLAILDAYWVGAALRSGDVTVQHQETIDGKETTVAGWVSTDTTLCRPPTSTGADGTTYCNGTALGATTAQTEILSSLEGRSIMFGPAQSALDFLVPAHEMTAAGVDLSPTSARHEPSVDARVAALCRGEADVAVVPLPVEQPSGCREPLQVIATTSQVPYGSVVTSHLPPELAIEVGFGLGATATCELHVHSCDPFVVPIWGPIDFLDGDPSPDHLAQLYRPVIDALADMRDSS